MKKLNYARIIVLVLSLALLIGSAIAITASAEEDASTGKFGAISLAHYDKVFIQVQVDATQEEIENEKVVVSYTLKGETKNATFYRTDAEGAWVITEGIAIFDLAQEITFNSYVDGVQVEFDRKYSVAQFLYKMIYVKEGVAEKDHALYKAILAHGEAAQMAHGINTDKLVTSSTIVHTNNPDITINSSYFAFAPATDLEVKPVWTGEIVAGKVVGGWYIIDNGVAKEVSTTFTCSGVVEIVEPVLVDHSASDEAHTFDQENTELEGALKSAADCENAAVYYKSCVCGAISNTETFVIGSSLGHDYYESVVSASTCTEVGTKKLTCSCGHTKNETIPAKGHTNAQAVKENEVAPNCTNAGSYDNVVYCSVCSTEISRETVSVDAPGHNYIDGNCSRCGKIEPTVYVNIKEYASSYGWEDLSRYYTVKMDDIITLNASENGSNNGKFVDGTDWKFYRSDNATLTVSVAEGYVIVSVTFTYNIYNNGILVFNGTNVESGTELTINSNSAVFSVGNTDNRTNGQIGFTNIDVVYAKTECTHENTTTTENATCTLAGSIIITCDDCSMIISTTEIPALGHNYVDGVCSRCSGKMVSVNIADYATSEEWENLERYNAVQMDDVIAISVSEGGSNNGKLVNETEWKFYRSDKGTITVSADEGYVIVSIAITYTNSNSGSLVFNGTNIASGTELTINSDSAEFSVGNTDSKTNGQIGFTYIEVVYAKV